MIDRRSEFVVCDEEIVWNNTRCPATITEATELSLAKWFVIAEHHNTQEYDPLYGWYSKTCGLCAFTDNNCRDCILPDSCRGIGLYNYAESRSGQEAALYANEVYNFILRIATSKFKDVEWVDWAK